MDSLNKPEKEYLLDLAFQAIKDGFDNLNQPPKNCPFKNLVKKKASFVTLNLMNQLRGCIGHLQPIQPLFKDVYENTQAAAFDDPRFLPLSPNELTGLEVEVSVLSLPQKLDALTREEKLSRLTNEPGVILVNQGERSTFLPQVWQQVKSKEEFLRHLSLKAGLNKNAWQNPDTILYTYNVDKFSKEYNEGGD